MPHYAVIYVRPGGDLDERQQQTCLAYCARHRYRADSLCFHADDAARLVESGVAQVVVVAFDANGDGDLEVRVRAAGGRLEYARPPRRTITTEFGRLVAGMFRRGGDVPTIAQLLDQPTSEIREALRRAGLSPPPRE